jgi:autotransporter-associated beta strand protein
MTGSQDPSRQTGTGSLVMNGAGTVALAATNTFTGGITINSGTVELAAAGAAGTGPIRFAIGSTAKLRIDAAALAAGESFTIDSLGAGDTIDIRGATWDATIANVAGTPTLALTGAPPVAFNTSGNSTAFTLSVARLKRARP